MRPNLRRVDPSEAIFPPTYIKTSTKLTMKIVNDSGSIMHYEWRKYSSEYEERIALAQIDVMDQNQRDKYANILHYDSAIFKIDPISSEIWPNRHSQFVVTFYPQIADIEEDVAYLYDKTSGDRIPFMLRGQGLPPQAYLSVQQIDVGHVSLDNTYDYEIVLYNSGMVNLDFEYDTSERHNLHFTFYPNRGRLAVGESIPIRIHFVANLVGQFKEVFHYKIAGINTQSPEIVIYGRVIGPSFSLSTNNLDFDIVSFGFLSTRTFEITNTSDIPFDYKLDMVHNNTFECREFSIFPNTGTIAKNSSQTIQVDFIPISIQHYNVNMLLTSSKIEGNLSMINIRAQCIAPLISIVQNEIDLGSVFIGHSYPSQLVLRNDTDYTAKFEYVDPTDISILDATVTVAKHQGVIAPHKESVLPIQIVAIQLGHIKITRYIKIYGWDKPPIPFNITALSTGPNIKLSTQSINFGSINVLNDVTYKLKILNDSLIPAPFRTEIHSESGVFKVLTDQAEIPPGESHFITIVAHLDDVVTFNGKLMLIFQNLLPINLNVVAKGSGTAIVPSIAMTDIEFGFLFTDQAVKRTFIFENFGRRQQEIKWAKAKPKLTNESPKIDFQYMIEPEQIVIPPRKSQEFTLTIKCNLPTTFQFVPQCSTTLGKKRLDLFKPVVKGIFIKPVIIFQRTLLEFLYIHDIEAEERLTGNLRSSEPVSPSKELLLPIEHQNSITNKSELPLVLNTICPANYKISPTHFELQPGETNEFTVTFFPHYKTDFLSQTLSSSIKFTFPENPQMYFLSLRCTFIFPNLSFNPPGQINFGSLLKHTEVNKVISIANNSKAVSTFDWELIQPPNEDEITKIFDVYPIRGCLMPDEEQDVHFTFFAIAGGQKGKSSVFNGTAICHVVGGPDYTIDLVGSSADIKFSIEPNLVDFGCQHFGEQLQATVTMSNTSDVPLKYKLKIPRNCSFKKIEVDPSYGTIPMNGSQEFLVKIITGLPLEYKEIFFFQIGDFEDAEVRIRVNSDFPRLNTMIPRAHDDPIIKRMTEEQNDPIEIEKDLVIERLKMKKPPRQITMRNSNVENFYYSKYVVDMGVVTLGQTKEVSYIVQSISHYPIAFELKTISLKGSGFSVEPTSLTNIPSMKPVQFQFHFETEKRTDTRTGDVTYDIPLVFSSGTMYLIRLVTFIKMPKFTYSHDHFDFEPTIVGQSRVLTLQIQNENCVPLEYTIGNAQTDILTKRDLSRIFIASPSSGILPPTSFQNIDVTFTPTNDRLYSMHFPIKVKYNADDFYFFLKGQGVQMRVAFDPPELIFPPIMPFENPSFAETELVNPTNYPIEVYSPQFDFQIFSEKIMKKYEEIHAHDEEQGMNLSSSPGSFYPVGKQISKFLLCIIVHGPAKSGKSTLSKAISEYFHIPVLSLLEIWGNLMLDDDSTDADYIMAFRETIDDEQYINGFVIDGLDIFTETAESEAFVHHCWKLKNAYEDCLKDPFTIFKHNELTACERALNMITLGLEGHYIFMIALTANDVTLFAHDQSAIEDRKKSMDQAEKEEMEALFNMDQDEYDNLPEDDKDEVDMRRLKYRIKLLGIDPEETTTTKGKRASRKTTRESEMRTYSSMKQRQPRKGLRKGVPTTDPLLISLLYFHFTLGTAAAMIRETCDYFQAIDPVVLFDDDNDDDPIKKTFKSNINTLVVDSSQPLKSINAAVYKFLPQMQKLKDKAFTRLMPPPRVNHPPPISLEFEPASRNFTIMNDEPPGVFPVYEKEAAPRFGRKKFVKARDTSLTDGLDINNFTKRWKIPPNSRERIRIKFKTDIVDDYAETMIFRICDCREDTFTLKLKGLCAYPDVNRDFRMIFPAVVQKLLLKTRMAFVTDANAFYFGALLVGANLKTKSQHALYRQSLKFKNNSKFPSEITGILRESGLKTSWTIETPNIVVQPEQTGTITIGFNPTSADTFKNTLSLYVRDNPTPFSFNLLADGCVPTIEFSPTQIDFERLLLNQERSITITMRNTCKISASWRIKNVQQVLPCFKFSTTQGNLLPRQTGSFVISFSSSKPVSIKKAFQIDVLDINKQKTFSSPHFNVSAEAFDVTFDFTYPKNMEHLIYGILKAGQSKTLNCVIRNRGKYQTTFDFKIGTRKLQNMMKISPQEGVLNPGDKGTNVSFTFKAASANHYKESKGITLNVYDKASNETITSLTIPFSVDTAFTQYTLEPQDKVDFGSVPTGISHSRQIIITNVGLFPFEFDVVPKSETFEPKNKTPRKRKPSAHTLSPPSIKRRTGNSKCTQVGQFSLSYPSSIVQPNQSIIIAVDFITLTPLKYDSSFIIRVTDSNPQANEVEFPLLATAFNPGLKINDPEKIFPGQQLCLRYDIEKSDVNAFLEDEQTFHFCPIMINETSSAKICLINPLPVFCNVDLAILTKKGTSISAKKKVKNIPFTISDTNIVIPPNQTSIVVLSFTPTMSQHYENMFEATVKGGTDTSTNILKFKIEGTGALPAIAVIDQENERINNINFTFGRTLVGVRKQKTIVVKNIGLVATKLMVNAKSSPDFEIDNIDFIHEFLLERGRQFNLSVSYCPKNTRKSQFNIGVNVIGNPKADLSIDLVGEGFSEEILFEGLVNDESEIYFKDNIVGRSQSITFTMFNTCDSDTKFMWGNHPDFKFSPRMGHLRHGQRKEITATFFSDKPVKYNHLKHSCQWSKIVFVDPDAPDWDDSMKITKFVQKSMITPQAPVERPPSGRGRIRRYSTRGSLNLTPNSKRTSLRQRKSMFPTEMSLSSLASNDENTANLDEIVKVVEVKEEPRYHEVNERTKDLSIKLNAICDVIKYQLSTNEIFFEPAMMFQTMSTTIELKNTSSIRFEYSWITDKFESFRTDYSKKRESPFSVRPASGFIEAGQTKEMTVTFAPVEVDTFSSHIYCEIPFLTQSEPPTIYVTGVSRRPICHVDAELSDYLTAGRRHPDFSYPISIETRVIEIFSKGVGTRTVRRFEIINTTAIPYEIFWTPIEEHQSATIHCETERAFISSGQRHKASFSYKPSSVKTVESLWELKIPDHEVCVQFLIVGRIMPK